MISFEIGRKAIGKSQDFENRVKTIKKYFTEFFGEEYRWQIEQRLDEAIYIIAARDDYKKFYIDKLKSDFLDEIGIKSQQGKKDYDFLQKSLLDTNVYKNFSDNLDFRRTLCDTLLRFYKMDEYKGRDLEWQKVVEKNLPHYIDIAGQEKAKYKEYYSTIERVILKLDDVQVCPFEKRSFAYYAILKAFDSDTAKGLGSFDALDDIVQYSIKDRRFLTSYDKGKIAQTFRKLSGKQGGYNQQLKDKEFAAKINKASDIFRTLQDKFEDILKNVQFKSSADGKDLSGFLIDNGFGMFRARSHAQTINDYVKKSSNFYAFCLLSSDKNDKIKNLAVFPCVMEDNVLVHELLHLISSRLFGVVSGRQFLKLGLETRPIRENSALNEVLTDYLANIITQKMAKAGDTQSDKMFTSAYSKLFEYLAPLFEEHMDIFKQQYIAGDRNLGLIKNELGEGNFVALSKVCDKLLKLSTKNPRVLQKDGAALSKQGAEDYNAAQDLIEELKRIKSRIADFALERE